jgi:hypothetical protein
MEQNGSETKYINGNDILCDNIKSTVTIGYKKDKHPDRLEENQRFRV